MLTIIVYLCFFIGLIELVKFPFKAYSALKNLYKSGGGLFGKRNRASGGDSRTATNGASGNGNNFDNCSDDGNCNGIPDIDD